MPAGRKILTGRESIFYEGYGLPWQWAAGRIAWFLLIEWQRHRRHNAAAALFTLEQDWKVVQTKPVSHVAALTRISHHLPVEARKRPAITALRLLAVLNVLFKYTSARRASRALY